ncbi:hypothetical protein [Amycolatopsis aidingensis]|uniref:hypothetical protein n=1 Tax=Amycolatopsis aidingensis TaxID=2842453 RepID=UPI001C0BEC54|nr:hypothetical protein [Amycolatopsis aidingensis]
MTLSEERVSLKRYSRNATRCKAIDVFPEPATPCRISTRAASLRITAFCSRWMVATMFFIRSSADCPSSRCSTSSPMLSVLSNMYSRRPPRILYWRLPVISPWAVPAGVSKNASPDSKS